MRELGLAARQKKKRKATTRPGRGRWRAPDLVKRDFRAGRINRKWFGDGTELVTGEGKLYLASVLDAASRRVLGFALGEHHDAELAYGALAMAVAVRGGQVPGVIMHTDQGSEYTAGAFRAACTRLGIRQSMGRPGSALDNAMIESWHSTLEFELRSVEAFATRAQARARVAAWIEEYNTRRRHSACQMMELLPPLVYAGLAHREHLMRCRCLAVRDPGELDVLVHGQVDHLAGCPGRSRQPAQGRPFIAAPEPVSSTTLVPRLSACRATERSRPSSTKRLPSAIGSPNSGIIQ